MLETPTIYPSSRARPTNKARVAEAKTSIPARYAYISATMESSLVKRGIATVGGSSANDVGSIDRPATEPPACTSTSEQGSGRFHDILTVALGQASGGKWYASTLQLQLASFEACVACRGVRTLRVTVDKRMPLSLWGNDNPFGGSVQDPEMRRLPALRAASVSWKILADMLVPLLSESDLLREVEWMQVTAFQFRSVGSHCAALPRPEDWNSAGTEAVHSPKHYFLLMVTFLSAMDHSEDGFHFPRKVCWPSALRQLSLGCTMSEGVDWAALPSCLERLALGGCFTEAIESVSWPVSLKHLTLGGWFDRCIADVVWPPSLLELTLGDRFNQPIKTVVWPASLLRLTFGNFFAQRIHAVVWPSSLLELTFGNRFEYSISRTAFPPSLQRLAIKGGFNRSIKNVSWPKSLTHLTFGFGFDQPIADVVWPASLEHLEFGLLFNQPITEVVWPIALKSLMFDRGFKQPIDGVAWPKSLRCLALSDRLVERAGAIVWPPSLESLIFREMFESHWPFGKDDFDLPDLVSVGRF